MYVIKPESIKTFIEDNSIRLPRFQRKQTWDDDSNFKLCISVFKEYPIGVSILSKETLNGKITKWLLDGRQRRNALIKISDDPENIYQWAKKFVVFKDSNQAYEVEDKFREKINEYLELDELEEKDEKKGEVDVVPNENILEYPKEMKIETKEDTYEQLSTSTKQGIELLLSIILLVHNKTKKHSGFSKPFDFTKWIPDLPYLEIVNSNQSLSSKKIKSFIKEYKTHCKDNSKEFDQMKSFMEFLINRFRLDQEKENYIRKEVENRWEKILDRIELLDKIDNILLHANIGLIEVENINTADGQKIFNIINTGGTKLTAVEILSAKPSWTKEIKNPNSELVIESKKLYDLIDIKNEDVVRWDIPATLLNRTKGYEMVFKSFNDRKVSDFQNKLTLGFKVLSGIFNGGIKKEDISSLSTKAGINWEIDFDKFINELNIVIRLISDFEYFKYFKSWKGSIMEILSDSIALNFIIITYLDWKRQGEPLGTSTSLKIFQKNAFILLDKLIYEYLNRQWLGATDTKVGKNIESLVSQPSIFIPIEEAKWVNLLEEIFEKNTCGDNPINQKLMEPILYHFYCMRNLAGPDSSLYSIEVDHIIPKSIFEASPMNNRDVIQHNLFNLGLLPKKENISKGNKSLMNINNDQWLKDQILKYEFIHENDYSKYSNLKDIENFKVFRKKFFLETFTSQRNNILN